MADNDDIVQKVRIEVEQDGDGASAFDSIKSSLQDAFEAIKSAFSDFDFGAAWEKLKEAGSKAFEGLKQAAGESLGNLAALAEANAERIGNAILAIGVAAAAAVTAIGLIGKAMYNFVEATSAAVNAMGELADRTQTSIQTLSAAQSFFAQAGVGPREFESAYRKLGDTVTSVWAQIKKETQDGAEKVKQAYLAADQAAIRLRETQLSLRNTNRDLSKQQRDDANAVADAQQRVAEADLRRRRASGQDTGQEEKSLARDKAENDVVRARQALQDAEARQSDNLAKTQDERLKRRLAAQQAELAAQQASKNARQNDRNDLGNITRGVQELATGNVDALRTFNATADNIVKGVVASAAEAGSAIKGLGTSFSGLSDTGPQVKDVLTQLGLVLKNIQDPVLKNQVAFKALGSASQDFIAALQTGDLDGFIKKMGELGGAVDEADKKIASDFVNSLTSLQDTLSNIGVKVSSAFGPAFTDMLNSINDAFNRSRDNIIRFAETIGSVVGPPLKLAASLVNAFSQTVNTLIDILRNVANLVKSAFGLSDIPMIKSLDRLYEILKGIAQILTGDIKKGIETLRKESFNELKEDSKKKVEDAKKQETPDAIFDKNHDEQGFPKKLTQAERDRIDFNAKQAENDELRRKGLPVPPDRAPSILQRAGQLLDPRPLLNDVTGRLPQSQPSQGPSALDRAGQLLDPRPLVNDLTRSLESMFQRGPQQPQVPGQQPGAQQQPAEAAGGFVGALNTAKDGLTSFGETLRRNLEQYNRPPEQKPPEAQPNAAADQQNSLLQQLLGKLGSAVQPQQDLKVDQPGAIDIRGDADQASQSLQNVATAAEQPVSPLQELTTAAQSAAAALGAIRGGGETEASIAAADGGHVTGAGTETSDSISARLSHNEFVQPARATRHYGVDFMEAVRTLRFPKLGFAKGGQVGSTILSHEIELQQAAQNPMAFITDALGQLSDKIDALSSKVDQLSSSISEALDKMAELISGQQRSNTNDDGSIRSAFGGHILGAGTETSDSIPAWLSHNEFVQPAKATKHYGVNFMESIRTLQFPKFNVGGLMSFQAPRFADGGLAMAAISAPAPVAPHLGTVDLRTDSGTIRAHTDPGGVRQLQRAAVTKRLTSTTKRKPEFMS